LNTSVATPNPAGRALRFLREEASLIATGATLAVFQFGGDRWLVNLSDPLLAGALFAWLFGVMLWASFGVVRHADALADLLGEPYGTLILTIAVISIEIALIAAVMLTGEAAPTLARDTMFAILMIVLNGLIGAALLIGGLRHREQEYNLQGARAFVAVLMPLAVFALVLPKFTVSTAEATFSAPQALFFGVITLLLYGVFLAIQTVRHRGFFQQPQSVPEIGHGAPGHVAARSTPYHFALLILSLLPIILLSKRLAGVVDFGTVRLGAPAELGGVVIALLVLTPEGLAALASARANHLQRSVNLLLGSGLATIGLTVPAVLAIGLLIDQPVTLGLDDTATVILVLSLVMSATTFGGARTNLLQGAVHLVIFFAYVALIFSP
jgi:Ca2+:H+ antiporter